MKRCFSYWKSTLKKSESWLSHIVIDMFSDGLRDFHNTHHTKLYTEVYNNMMQDFTALESYHWNCYLFNCGNYKVNRNASWSDLQYYLTFGWPMQSHCWMTKHCVAARMYAFTFLLGGLVFFFLEPSASYHPQLFVWSKPFVTRQTSTGDPLVSLHVRNLIS